MKQDTTPLKHTSLIVWWQEAQSQSFKDFVSGSLELVFFSIICTRISFVFVLLTNNIKVQNLCIFDVLYFRANS